MEQIISILLMILGLYLLCGFLFSMVFFWKGLTRVDKGTIGTGWGFKLLILPGTIAFWPVLLKKWIKISQSS